MAQDQKQCIGILGGSFDPVHYGHCAIAQLAYDYFSLTKVLFIPAANPPHKSRSVVVEKTHRLEMLYCAIKDNPAFELWEGEFQRGGISYTIDTLQILRQQYKDAPLYFIIGSDNIQEIMTWHRYQEIIQMVTLCVAYRPGYSLRIPEELLNATICQFPSPRWGISSSLIRSYLKKNLSCKYLIPPAVETYIFQNKLYRTHE